MSHFEDQITAKISAEDQELFGCNENGKVSSEESQSDPSPMKVYELPSLPKVISKFGDASASAEDGKAKPKAVMKHMYVVDKMEEEEEESKILPSAISAKTKVAAKPAAAEASSMNLRSRKQPVKEASSSAEHKVVAKRRQSRAKRRPMKLPDGRRVRRVPVPKKEAPPGMKYIGGRAVANFTEEEDNIIRDEVAAGTSRSNIANMLSRGKEYKRSKGQVQTRVAFLGLAKKSDVVRNPIRPDTELGKKLFPLYHAIKVMQDEGKEVNILQMCRDEGLEFDSASNGYTQLKAWLKGKDLPKALLTDKRSVSCRDTKAKKKAATKKAGKTNELESDFY